MLRAAIAIVLGLWATVLSANQAAMLLPSSELRGQATFRFLGLPIYEARLFTDNGQPFDWTQAFVLEVEYLRRISEATIVNATMRELRRLGHSTTPQLREEFSRCFEASTPGDVFSAVPMGANRIGFWFNGRPTCELQNPGIRNGFLGIFLGQNTRSMTFTQALKGTQ